ncbi:Protein CBG05658 [Caenorhabditis briggsae]|uniref:Protein CBG05658 n=1 Tax=Caenorhabditis briggsae TaxID=6238 RepID=A8X0D4_CAEBR|nr:Protein CBG05658 [Caenorhabditis briggsae]CAP26094.2 Protein CBG05658 [Caenorhabditis briggsae]
MAIWFAGEDLEVSEFIRDTMLLNFNLNPQEYTYAASLFYRINPLTSLEYPSISDFLFVLNIDFIIISGFSIITFCWYRLRKIFTEITFNFRTQVSRRTLEMQHQLFKSLVAQTVFPLFLLFFPAGCVLIFPIFKLQPGRFFEAFLLPLMATQSFIDSVVPMYFIKEYKKAIRKVFGKKSNPETSTGNARVFPILEELMTFIGSKYPHYRHTVLPVIIVFFFIFFSTRLLDETKKVTSPEVAQNNRTNEFFYSKCHGNERDDSLRVAENADFVKQQIPSGQLTIVINALFMFGTTTISPRSLVLFILGVISVAFFFMAHFPSQLQMSIFVTLVFSEAIRASARALSIVFVRLPSDQPLNMSHSFEVFGFITIIMGFLAYYTFHDSLHNLLARSKTDKMQDRVSVIFEKAEIPLSPDAVIDQIAFESFENAENPIEILVKTLKSFKLVREVLICGLISGACLAVTAFAEAKINRHGEVMYFEKTLIPGATYVIFAVIVIILAVLMPKKRILPVIILTPILFVFALMVFLIPAFFKSLDECTQHWIVSDTVFPVYLAIAVFTSALTDVIRFYVKVHLLEVMPALIRAPIYTVLRFVQYSFDGNVRALYETESIGGEAILILISVIAMLVLLIDPRKKNEMNNTDKQKTIPPAPEFVN